MLSGLDLIKLIALSHLLVRVEIVRGRIFLLLVGVLIVLDVNGRKGRVAIEVIVLNFDLLHLVDHLAVAGLAGLSFGFVVVGQEDLLLFHAVHWVPALGVQDNLVLVLPSILVTLEPHFRLFLLHPVLKFEK